jgi:hypothetical protein
MIQETKQPEQASADAYTVGANVLKQMSTPKSRATPYYI